MSGGPGVHGVVRDSGTRLPQGEPLHVRDPYVTDRLALLERGLEASVVGLGAGLGALGSALDLAVGTGGRGGARC